MQQIDSGAFADDDRQHRWLERAGFTQVRTWWQMTRPVEPDEADLDAGPERGVRIRPVERQGTGMPDEDDLRTVHEILESAFADHFNSHEETFDEFVSRLREDPGHRWDHWWIAELVDDDEPEPAGALVGAVSPGRRGAPDGSYVEYIGVLQNARGRGVAKSLLRTVIADAASRGGTGSAWRSTPTPRPVPTGSTSRWAGPRLRHRVVAPERPRRSKITPERVAGDGYGPVGFAHDQPRQSRPEETDANPFHACRLRERVSGPAPPGCCGGR